MIEEPSHENSLEQDSNKQDLNKQDININDFFVNFSIENFEKNFTSHLETLSAFTNDIKIRTFLDFQKITDTNGFERELTDYTAQIKKLLKIKPELDYIINFLDKAGENLKIKFPKVLKLGKFVNYYGPVNEANKMHGLGLYNNADQIVFYGEFNEGFFSNGILVRKSHDNTIYNLYIGKFSKKEAETTFHGVYYPNVESSKLIVESSNESGDVSNEKFVSMIYGTILNDTRIEGTVVNSFSTLDLDNKFEIVNGVFENYQKTGHCLVLNYDEANNSDALAFYYGAFKENKPVGTAFSFTKGQFLNSLKYNDEGTMEGATAIYFILNNGVFIGPLESMEEPNCISIQPASEGTIFYPNSHVYEGLLNKLKKEADKAEYYIKDSVTGKINYILKGEFGEDTFKKGAVYKINEKGEEFLLFEGEINKLEQGYIKGVYNYENGESYKGMIVNWKREGHGEYIYADGGKYIGGWKENCKHEKGTYVDPTQKNCKEMNFDMDKEIKKIS